MTLVILVIAVIAGAVQSVPLSPRGRGMSRGRPGSSVDDDEQVK